jgi:hypothetical protein
LHGCLAAEGKFRDTTPVSDSETPKAHPSTGLAELYPSQGDPCKTPGTIVDHAGEAVVTLEPLYHTPDTTTWMPDAHTVNWIWVSKVVVCTSKMEFSAKK